MTRRGSLLWRLVGKTTEAAFYAHAGRIALIGLLAVGLAAMPAAASGPGPVQVALPGFPDTTGASGESEAVFLNPVAATGLTRPTLGLWAVLPDAETAGGSPAYAVSLLDPGGRLAGGLVATFTGTGSTRVLALSYTVAGRLGPLALGVRPVWSRSDPEGATWTLDAGMAVHPAPWLSLTVAALDYPAGGAGPSSRKPWGQAGLTLTVTGLAGTLLEGSQVSVGFREPDLESTGGGHALAGLRLPVGERLRLAVGYEEESPAGGGARWSGSLALRVGATQLDLGYRSDNRYRLGLQLGW